MQIFVSSDKYTPINATILKSPSRVLLDPLVPCAFKQNLA